MVEKILILKKTMRLCAFAPLRENNQLQLRIHSFPCSWGSFSGSASRQSSDLRRVVFVMKGGKVLKR